MHTLVRLSVVIAAVLITGSFSLRGSDYAGTVLGRWDIGIGFQSVNLTEETEEIQSSVSSTNLLLTAGLNFPILYSDSSLFSLGVNPSLILSAVSTFSDPMISVGVPLLVTLKFNNDAQLKPPSGWRVGATIGGGVTYNNLISSNTQYGTLTDWIPTVMAEVNVGKRKNGFPGVLKLRYTKPLGERTHFGNLKYTVSNISLTFTTGF